MARLLHYYHQEVVPELKRLCGRDNPWSVPRLEKICLNMGVGEAVANAKAIEEAAKTMAALCGQMPMITKAAKSVSNFRLRQGLKIGCRATLRGRRMYEFFDRLVNAAIPRIRDFRGLNPLSFDRYGNYSFGIEEVAIFPEVDIDKLEFGFGMDIAFVIRNSHGVDESRHLLRLLGMPFRE